MWIKRYLIQLIKSCHISLYKKICTRACSYIFTHSLKREYTDAGLLIDQINLLAENDELEITNVTLLTRCWIRVVIFEEIFCLRILHCITLWDCCLYLRLWIRSWLEVIRTFYVIFTAHVDVIFSCNFVFLLQFLLVEIL